MDKLYNKKPYFLMDDLEGNTPILETSKKISKPMRHGLGYATNPSILALGLRMTFFS